LGYEGEVQQPTATRSADPTEAPRSLAVRLLLGAAASFVVALPFLLLMALVLSEWEPLERVDRSVADDLHEVALANGWLVDVLEVGEVVTSPWLLRVVVAGVAWWLWRRGSRLLATWALVTAAVGGLLGGLFKLIVERARPGFPEPVATSGGYSFPSGHALNSVLLMGVLLIVFVPLLGRAGRVLAYAGAAVFVLVTGYDRIGLGVHYVSDVVAGWVVALACLAGTVTAFELWRRERGLPAAGAERGLEPEAVRRLTDPPGSGQ
jgi:undecaprenyl-diphosphatase